MSSIKQYQINQIKWRQKLKVKNTGEANVTKIISKNKWNAVIEAERKDTCTFSVMSTVNTYEVFKVVDTAGNHSLLIFRINARTTEFHWDELKIKLQCQ